MLIIDRFEDEFAVVENTVSEEMLLIERAIIDLNAKEGDVITFADGMYHVDYETTKKRRAEVLALLKKIDPD